MMPVPKAHLSDAPWFEHAWRRAVIDMHIPDWDSAFLSEFNPDDYVKNLVPSHAQSTLSRL